MLKPILLLLKVFKDLLFKNRSESNYKSRNFNKRKYIAYLLMTFSLFLNVFLVHGISKAVNKYIELKKEEQKLLKTTTLAIKKLEEDNMLLRNTITYLVSNKKELKRK